MHRTNGPGLRLFIVGPTGAGKSTLAGRLARRLDLPLIALDGHLLSGRRPIGEAQARAAAARLAQGERWVIEGTHWRTIDILVDAATIVVFLDVPLARSLPRYVRREIRARWTGSAAGCLADVADLFRHGVLWSALFPLVERPRVVRTLARAPARVCVIRASGPVQAERLVMRALAGGRE